MADPLMELDNIQGLSSLLDDAQDEPSGAKYFIDLAQIEPDPNQPRKSFDEISLKELAQSIVLRGVLQPISVRENPVKPGSYLINQGERRFRASKLAGKLSIPAIIDNDFVDDDQMIENIQREALTHEEIFNWICAKLDEGLKKGEIAQRLGKSNAFITQYVTLKTISDDLHQLFSTGRCRDLTVINDLAKLEKTHSAEVLSWLADSSDSDITRSTVKQIKEHIADLQSENCEEEISAEVDIPHQEPQDLDESDSNANTSAIKWRKPALYCTYKGSSAKLLLSKPPSQEGLAWLEMEDGKIIEVDLSKVRLVALVGYSDRS